MTHTDIQRDAGLDQTAAMLRDARKELLRVRAALIDDRDSWYLDSHKLAVLLDSLLDSCCNVEECRSVAAQVLGKPWNWRAEYVCAKCRQLDTKGGV